MIVNVSTPKKYKLSKAKKKKLHKQLGNTFAKLGWTDFSEIKTPHTAPF